MNDLELYRWNKERILNNLSELVEKALDTDILNLKYWLDTLTPDKLLKLEVWLRRLGEEEKADIVEYAGYSNCGNEYDN